MQREYFDRMVLFSETPEGMVSGLETWINGAGADRCRSQLAADLLAAGQVPGRGVNLAPSADGFFRGRVESMAGAPTCPAYLIRSSGANRMRVRDPV